MKALRIDVDGTREMVEITGDSIEAQNDCIWEMLGGYFDCIRLAFDGVVLVDDEGLLKDLPLNPAAMLITGYPAIAGTALIVGTKDTPDGEIFTDCPEHYADYA